MQEQLSTEKFLERARMSNLELATKIKDAAKHHIESFNFMTDGGLDKICEYMTPVDIINEQKDDRKSYLNFKHMRVWYENLEIGTPVKNNQGINMNNNRILPTECRISKKTYGAPLYATIARSIDGVVDRKKVNLGDIPIVVMSDRCHLSKMSTHQLVHEAHEDCNEFGGYFVINGNEKIIRMLILQKRNYPIAFTRGGYVNRGPNYTHFAVQAKCVRPDLQSKTITLHYVSDGNVFLRLLHKKQEFLIPIIVILKALVEVNDVQVYNKLVKGKTEKSAVHDRVEVMLRGGKAIGLNRKDECLAYLGQNFRIVLNITNPEINDKEVGEIFLKENICIHLKDNKDKFNFICLMIEKLYAMVSDEILPDNLDSLQNQEILLPGHLYQMFLREKLEESLLGIRAKVFKDGSRPKDAQKINSMEYLQRALITQGSIGKKIEYLLSTGNLKSNTGLDLMQAKGFAIIADKLNNMRFLSHFRSIHRGAYFAEMKTTTVRKLLPELWGFICPVHTPDGGPCGLLQHIAAECIPLTKSSYDEEKHKDLEKIICEMGMSPIVNDLSVIYPEENYPVLLDGRLIGYIDEDLVDNFVQSLRYLKIQQNPEKLVPQELEIGYVPKTYLQKNPTFPGIYLHTNEARFIRPVKHLKLDKVEYITPFEQPWLSIACMEEDIRVDTEYQEISYAHTLSILSTMIPFLNYNQSPRNMYQCQMAKQTMGTSMHNFPYRFDNRTYRLMSGQVPLVKGKIQEDYAFADYPSGNNAVVAVISYTGYDMEDACIINKSSYERGFGHGCVYKNYGFEVNDTGRSSDHTEKSKFKLLNQEKQNIQNNNLSLPEGLQIDGIPRIGSTVKKNTPIFSIYDTTRNSMKTFYHKEAEAGRLDGVAIVQGDNPQDVKVEYRVRIPRNPIIGDKFSSRHGQKGVLSVLWPQVDMPFTEQGIVPDLIINPHAFPSRMTIGMLIESMAGKSAALNGKILEYDPFQPFEDDDVVKFFGKQLEEHGYNYAGNETMYSGTYGKQMKVQIFIGTVFYQRLRHMVSDKSQARSTGPVDILTQQPIKGRKRGGGIRMGEMERDALLAHGISFCLHDRFMNCSDYSEGYICNKCGSMISSFAKSQVLQGSQMEQFAHTGTKLSGKGVAYCSTCKANDCSKVRMPYVLRYLTNELAAMNVKMTYKMK